MLSTVNVQHLASLGDVVSAITDVHQAETVPDDVVRRADQIHLVDISPELLRQRLGDGKIYAADKIDAALSNYFRLGNLTALRELALLWLADRVDEGLAKYRAEQGIEASWPARERIVVGLTGSPEGEVLIRRGARILNRVNGGDLLAVHVRSADGLAEESPQALEAQRRLILDLGGSYHIVTGEDPAAALLDFARSVNATQIVVGISRHKKLAGLIGNLLGGGVGTRVVRDSGDIDVHMVSHPLGGRGTRPRTAARPWPHPGRRRVRPRCAAPRGPATPAFAPEPGAECGRRHAGPAHRLGGGGADRRVVAGHPGRTVEQPPGELLLDPAAGHPHHQRSRRTSWPCWCL